MYQQLIEQYENLDIEEKNALLVYKSRLFKFINNIDLLLSAKENYEKDYEEAKELIYSPENNFIRYSVFKDIDFTSYELFLKSVKNIEQKLLSLKNKIKLIDNVDVYRATTLSSLDNISQISNSELISTSMDVEVTDSFYQIGLGNHVLYKLSLKKDTPCLVVPYSIEIHNVNNKQVLKVVQSDTQQEIILYGSTLDFEITNQKYFEEEDLTVIKMNATYSKNNIK